MYNTSYSIKTGRYSKVMQGTRIATYKVICRPTRLEQEGKRGKGSPVMRQSLIIPHPKPTYLKSLPSRPPARLFTIDPPNALFAKVDAWLNLSHREKASVLVMVKASAMAVEYQYRETLRNESPGGIEVLTNKAQPNHILQLDDGQDGQADPQCRGHV